MTTARERVDVDVADFRHSRHTEAQSAFSATADHLVLHAML